jgi:hypothetical protein
MTRSMAKSAIEKALAILLKASELDLFYIQSKRMKKNPDCHDLISYGPYMPLHHSQHFEKHVLSKAEADDILQWYQEARDTAAERELEEKLEFEAILRDQSDQEETLRERAAWEAKLRESEKAYEDRRDQQEAEARAKIKKHGTYPK